MKRLTFVACITLCMLWAGVMQANDEFSAGFAKGSTFSENKDQEPKSSKSRTPTTQVYPGPVISEVTRKSQRPFPRPDETVRVQFKATQGTETVDPSTAIVRFRVNGGAATTIEALHLGGNIYTAELPAQEADDVVSFEPEVRDVKGMVSLDNNDSYYYRVLNREATIADVREPFYLDGASAYEGFTVTVSGVVTIAAANLPNPTQQQPIMTLQSADFQEYGAISILSDAELAQYNPGDEITVIGTVDHLGDVTVLRDVLFSELISSGNQIAPLNKSIYDVTGTDENGFNLAERYESMFVQIENLQRFNSIEEVRQIGVIIGGPRGVGPGGLDSRFEIDLRFGAFLDQSSETQLFNFSDGIGVYGHVQGVIFSGPSETSLIPRTDEDFGEMTVTRAADEELAVLWLSTAPNPSTDIVKVSYHLAAAGHISVDVYNMQGTHVAALMDATVNAGVGMHEFDIRALPVGNYYVVLKTSGQACTHVMTVLR